MFLPVFPLQLVVFPREKLKLHIFEPRYKQLIEECREHEITFGIPPFVEDALATFGTEVSLVSVLKVHDDGEMDIVTEGRRVFELKRFVREAPNRLYPGAEVAFVANDPDPSGADIAGLRAAYDRFHQLRSTGYTRDDFDRSNLSFELAQEVGLTLRQKIELLALPREADRLEYLLDHLHAVIPLAEGMEETRRSVTGNGHVKRPAKLDF